MHSETLWRDKLSLWLGLPKRNKSSSSVVVYSEAVYCNLVRSESKRSERSGHLCRILLVYRTNTQGLIVPLGSELADKTISVLSSGCRDTDYVGWYRQGQIVGVLLTVLRPYSARDGCDSLKARLVDSLRGTLTFIDDHFLQIHLLEPGELTAFNASNHPTSFPGSKD